jgi:hypothetical protein
VDPDSQPGNRGTVRILVCLLLLMVARDGAYAQASAPESNPNKCAMLNLAHFYLKCARLNDALIGLISNPSAGGEVRKAVKVSEAARTAFISVAFNLYKIAGRELTPEVLAERRNQDEPDVASGLEEFLRTVQNRVARKKAKLNPTNVLYQCTGPAINEEIKTEAKVRERLGRYRIEADELIKKKPSCIR